MAAKSVAWIFLVSSFIGSALPASVGGDAARAYTLSRRTDNTSEAVASVAVDRLLGVLSLAVLAVTGALLWGTTTDALPVGWVAVAAGVVGTSCAGIFWADRLLRGHPTVIVARLASRCRRARSGRRPVPVPAIAVSRWRGVFALSLLVQLLRVFQAYLLGLGPRASRSRSATTWCSCRSAC